MPDPGRSPRWSDDPGSFGEPRQECLVALTRVAPHNATQRCIRFQRRGVHSQRLALDQPRRSESVEDPAEHSSVRFHVDNRRVLRSSNDQEAPRPTPIPQTHARSASLPRARQSPFRIDPFEVSQHQQSEVHPRRQARPSHRRCVEGLTQLFDILVEPVLLQNPIQSFVKRMRRTPRQLLGGDPYRLLAKLPVAFTHGHGRTFRNLRSSR